MYVACQEPSSCSHLSRRRIQHANSYHRGLVERGHHKTRRSAHPNAVQCRISIPLTSVSPLRGLDDVIRYFCADASLPSHDSMIEGLEAVLPKLGEPETCAHGDDERPAAEMESSGSRPPRHATCSTASAARSAPSFRAVAPGLLESDSPHSDDDPDQRIRRGAKESSRNTCSTCMQTARCQTP